MQIVNFGAQSVVNHGLDQLDMWNLFLYVIKQLYLYVILVFL